MNLQCIHDEYKLAMDQWQRLTHAVRMGHRDDVLDSISKLEASLFAMNATLRLQKFIGKLDAAAKKKIREA